MERIPYGKYSDELRAEAVKLVVDEDVSIQEAGKRLSIPTSTVRNWVSAYRAGSLADVGKTRSPLSERDMELARLKRELAEVKMERDLLKNRPKGVRLSL